MANRPRQGQNSPYGRSNIDIGGILGAAGVMAPSVSGADSGARVSPSEVAGGAEPTEADVSRASSLTKPSYPTAHASFWQNLLSGGKAGMAASQMNYQSQLTQAENADITSRLQMLEELKSKHAIDENTAAAEQQRLTQKLAANTQVLAGQGILSNPENEKNYQANVVPTAMGAAKSRYKASGAEAEKGAQAAEQEQGINIETQPEQLAARKATFGAVPLSTYFGLKTAARQPYGPFTTIGAPGQQDTATILPNPQMMAIGAGGKPLSSPISMGLPSGEFHKGSFIPQRDQAAEATGFLNSPQINLGPTASTNIQPKNPVVPAAPLTQPRVGLDFTAPPNDPGYLFKGPVPSAVRNIGAGIGSGVSSAYNTLLKYPATYWWNKLITGQPTQ